MNIQTNWGIQTNVLLYVDNKLYTNELTVVVNAVSNTADKKEQLVNYSRQKVFLTSVLEDSIFVDNRNPNSWKILEDLEQNFVYLPTTPTDFNILYALYNKLISIAEDKFIIDYVSLSSRMGDDISYAVSNNVIVPEFKTAPWCAGTNVKPWWTRNDITTRDDFLTNGDLIQNDLSWEELDLGYDIVPVDKKESKFKIITGGKNE